MLQKYKLLLKVDSSTKSWYITICIQFMQHIVYFVSDFFYFYWHLLNNLNVGYLACLILRIFTKIQRSQFIIIYFFFYIYKNLYIFICRVSLVNLVSLVIFRHLTYHLSTNLTFSSIFSVCMSKIERLVFVIIKTDIDLSVEIVIVL